MQLKIKTEVSSEQTQVKYTNPVFKEELLQNRALNSERQTDRRTQRQGRGFTNHIKQNVNFDDLEIFSTKIRNEENIKSV